MLFREMKLGTEVSGFDLLIANSVEKPSGGGPYLELDLKDSSGESIVGKIWNATPALVQMYKAPVVIRVNMATYQDFRGKPQMVIKGLEPNPNRKIGEFIKTAPITAQEMIEYFGQEIEAMRKEMPRILLKGLLTRVGDKLLSYPAAKTNHHNYHAGLAYHMGRMLEIGMFVCDQRPFLERDYVRFGIIAHDIAKPAEMDASGGLGIVTDYTPEGMMVGHIGIVHKWMVEEAMRNDISSDDPEFLLLENILLSHHGQLAWGSPVTPKSAEAVALHHIDNLDAKLQTVEDALAPLTEVGQWSEPIKSMEFSRFYKTKI